MSSIRFDDTDTLEIFYLKRFWSFYQDIKNSKDDSSKNTVEWSYVNALFNAIGIGTEPTIKYILSESNSFSDFEKWIEKNGTLSPQLIEHFNTVVSNNENANSKPMSIPNVLSEADLKQWDEKGYVVIKNAISEKDCKLTEELIYKTIDATPEDSHTWYKQHEMKQGIMVQLFQNEQLNKNRLSPKIKSAFEQLWQRTDLLVSMDRVSFNPPENEQYQFPGPNLHWDVSLKRPIPYGLQGLLYLSDTEKSQGAFTVIPGFQNKIDSWLENLPEGENPRDYKHFDSMVNEPIAGESGDFIIWNHCLPHGSSPNTALKPRIVQYINYQPIDMEVQTEWI